MKIFFKIWAVVLAYLYVLGFFSEYVISRPMGHIYQVTLTFLMVITTTIAFKLIYKFLKPIIK